MARDFAWAFYHSPAWKKTRNSYMRLGQGLCEPCLKKGRYTPAEIVHHKVHLSPLNIHDPKVTLDYANLERVCRECHAKAHSETERREPRCAFDADGNVVPLEGALHEQQAAGQGREHKGRLG